MNTIFPFGLPGATQWYLALYLATLLMHVAFMNYVLAGTMVLAAGGVRGRLGAGDSGPILRVLKDWMPFSLSAAITAGIAPLLFIQVLYQREFYTANLLLFHRWMAILPVLIVAFYLLYLLKAKKLDGRTAIKGASSVAAAMCFLFVAWSWTENHLLSLSPALWAEQYESRAMLYRSVAIWPRLAMWVFGAFPTLSVLVAWQLRLGASGTSASDHARTARPLALLALGGLVLSAAALGWYREAAGPGVIEAATSVMALPYAIAAIVGALAQVAAWAIVFAKQSLAKGALILASVGLTLTFIGTCVVRETVRLKALEPALATARHADASSVAGLTVFLIFAAIALGTICWVFTTVRRALDAKR